MTTTIGKALTVFIISMVPVIELRGAIPWGIAHDLPVLQTFILALAGNILPVPFIILFLRRIFNWMEKNKKTAPLVKKLNNIAHQKGQKVLRYKRLGLYILVAIPLPGTGAWTGALVASVLDIRLRHAFPIILLGVITAGVAMLFISYGVKSLV